jgi:hypothetical protein
VVAVAERDWRHDAIDAANAAGRKASMDQPDAILMADARNNLVPGGDADRLADALAADLEAKAAVPVSRATCAALVRAACNLQALALLGWSADEILTVLAAAAAKLEMRAKS